MEPLVFSADLAAPVEQVWRAVEATDNGARLWARVLDGDVTDAHRSLLGSWFVVTCRAGRARLRCEVIHSDAPRRVELCLTWTQVGDQPHGCDHVLVKVDPLWADGGTRVTVTHTVTDPDERALPYVQSWPRVLQQLAAVVSSLGPASGAAQPTRVRRTA